MSKEVIVLRAAPLEIKLSEGKGPESVPKKVQLMRECTFFHKKYGKVVVTRSMFSEMVENFNKKVRRIDPFIDYSHESDRDAAGWISSLEIVDNTQLGESELWAVVDWTQEGALTLSDKKYRYLSADFDPKYEDNETPGIIHGHVLLGAGLTNRPVIKGMQPITTLQLSELYKETSMTEEEIKAAEGKLNQINKLMQDMGVSSVEELMAKIGSMQTDNKELGEAKLLAEKKVATDRLFSEGKLTKAQVDEAVKLPKESFDSFIKLAEMNSPIKLSEAGHGGKGSTKTKVNAEDQVITLAEKKAVDNKIDIGTAISMVLSENPELKKAYEAGEESEIEVETEE